MKVKNIPQRNIREPTLKNRQERQKEISVVFLQDKLHWVCILVDTQEGMLGAQLLRKPAPLIRATKQGGLPAQNLLLSLAWTAQPQLLPAAGPWE